jgi:hypothetical protein
MSYGGTYFPEDFPFGDKEAQYEYGVKDAYKAWDKMVERATIGSMIVAQTPYRAEPEGTPISNMIRHLAYCEHNEYNSDEYFEGFIKGAEEKIREAIIKEKE